MPNFEKDRLMKGVITRKFCKLRDFMNFLQVEEILMISLERNSKIENKTEIKKEKACRKNYRINHISRNNYSRGLLLLSAKGIRTVSMEMGYFWTVFN